MNKKKMTQEDKELLYKDLCSRKPYFLKVQWGEKIFNIIGIGFGRATLIIPFMSCTSGTPLIEEIRPLLRPLDDATEDEIKEYERLSEKINNPLDEHIVVDWLDSHFFDHRGLIERELAIKTTKETYENLIGQLII